MAPYLTETILENPTKPTTETAVKNQFVADQNSSTTAISRSMSSGRDSR